MSFLADLFNRVFTYPIFNMLMMLYRNFHGAINKTDGRPQGSPLL